MASPRQSARLESLPNEILDNIAGLVQPYSLVAFALASHRLYDMAASYLTEHKDLHASLSLTKGCTSLRLAELLIALLEDPRKARFIVRWKTGGHLDLEDEQDHRRDCEGEEDPEEPGSEEQVDEDLDPEERFEQNKDAVRSRLMTFLENSALIPDSMRADLCSALEQTNQHPKLHALGLLLCHDLAELDMAEGEDLCDIMEVLPSDSLRHFLSNLERFNASAYGDQEMQARLNTFASLLTLPKLHTMQLKWTYTDIWTDIDMPDGPHACPLAHLVLEECMVPAKALGSFLSGIAKGSNDIADSNHALGLQSLVYNFGLGMMGTEYVIQAFNAPSLIAAIRDNTGQTLAKLDFTCDESVWNWARDYDDECSWDLTIDANLRAGFARLKEVTLGPEFLVSGWCCPRMQWGSGQPLEAATIDPDVESLPLAAILPESLEILKIRSFNTEIHPLAAPVVLQKLITHFETDLETTTPKLSEVHLMDAQAHDNKSLNTAEFEAELDKFVKLCKAKNVLLARG